MNHFLLPVLLCLLNIPSVPTSFRDVLYRYTLRKFWYLKHNCVIVSVSSAVLKAFFVWKLTRCVQRRVASQCEPEHISSKYFNSSCSSPCLKYFTGLFSCFFVSNAISVHLKHWNIYFIFTNLLTRFRERYHFWVVYVLITNFVTSIRHGYVNRSRQGMMLDVRITVKYVTIWNMYR